MGTFSIKRRIVVAVAISVGFLGETLTGYAVLGAIAILVSILLVSGLEVRGKSLSVSETGGSRVRVFR